MDKYEYCIVGCELSVGTLSGKLRPEQVEKCEQILNDHGSQGWELVSMAPVNSDFGDTAMFVSTFKRKLM